jgi:hypothetical protein
VEGECRCGVRNACPIGSLCTDGICEQGCNPICP